MDYQDVKYEEQNGVALLTLNRPEKLNAARARTVYEMLHVLERADRNDDIRALVITGSGRAFCAGADLTSAPSPEDATLADEFGYRRIRESPISHWGTFISTLGHYRKPVIAAVNGIAAGGGLSISLAADIRIGSTEASFISVFVRRAMTPDTGTSFHLPRIIGDSRALEMMLTGDAIDAVTAERWGLVNRLVEPAELMPSAMALAERLASGPSVVLELTKRLVRDQTHQGLDRQLQSEAWALTVDSEDRAEGRSAFLERRPPAWKGR